ncbi:MAG: hypothetical protein R3F61_36235 [Myxococcota bacterium]
MRKLLFMASLLALATACPKVERKVYTFDLKAKTGVLYFENIVTDAPESADGDFMEIVNKVVRGTKLEEENPGWNIAKKELYDNSGRLDGKMEFSFSDASGAGLYKYDKKAPYIWCASREEEETIVATNGTRIAELPGCVAWDRKATELSVTVRTATMSGTEAPLTDQWKRWSNGEELKSDSSSNPFGGMMGGDGGSMDALAEGFAGGLASGMADAMAGDAKLTVGPAKPTGASQEEADKAIGSLQQATLKVCIATAAAEQKAFSETLQVEVAADGTFAASVKGSTAADAEREKCYQETLQSATFPKLGKAWSLAIPLAVEL